MSEPVVVRAARAGDVGTVRRLLAEDPRAAAAFGWMRETPLHAAASGGSLVVARLLIEAGAQPMARRDNGDTPLHRAATGAMADLLIRAAGEGAVNEQNNLQQTALHTTLDSEVAEVLVRYGADVTARDYAGGTPLHGAGAAKVRVLLAAGADVAACDDSGRTALYRAVWNGDAEVVELLLAAGADPAAGDPGSTSPLHLARRRTHRRIRHLLEAAMSVSGRLPTEAVDPATVTGSGQYDLRVGRDGRSAYSVTGRAVLVRWRLDQPLRADVAVTTGHAGFGDIAVHPRRPLLAVAPHEAPVELRHSDDLTCVAVFPSLVDVAAVAFSPDGLRLAAATGDERVVLFDLTTQQVTGEVEGGEWTGCLAFSPDGSLLASACSFQGGAYVRLDRVTTDGRLEPAGSVDRASHGTPPQRFVDTMPSVSFIPDGRGLVIWETSAIYHGERPAGWRGDIVMADPASGHVVWQRSIDADTTGVPTSLGAIGSPMGYSTTPAATPDSDIIAVGVDGTVVLLAAADGATRAVLPIAGKANTVCVDHDTATLLIATDQHLQQHPYKDKLTR